MTAPLPCPFCGDAQPEPVEELNDTSTWGNFILSGGSKWGAYQCGCGARAPDVRTGYQPVSEWAQAAVDEWNNRKGPPE